MRYFENCNTIEELKAEYRRLAMKNHPDRGGDEETMKAINQQYDEAFERMKNGEQTRTEGHSTNRHTESPEQFRDIINALIQLDGLVIEICGCWIWISGNTYAHREALKKAGCGYASGKKMWYWHSPETASRNRRKTTMNEIRERYGSTIIESSSRNAVVVA